MRKKINNRANDRAKPSQRDRRAPASGTARHGFINDQGRLFGVISVIDIFVIAVVAVLAVAVLTKSSPTGTPAAVNTVPVEYTVYISSVRDTHTTLLREGDSLYTNTGTFIGVITGVEVSEARTPSFKGDGSYVLASVEERYDVLLTVSAQCSVSGGRYYADRTYELCANTDQMFCTKYNEMSGIIMDIRVESNG